MQNGRDSHHLGVGQGLADVFFGVLRVAVVVIVRTAVGKYDQEFCARFLSKSFAAAWRIAAPRRVLF